MGCASLWTTIPIMRSPAFTSAIMPWTKIAPLSIRSDSPSTKMIPVLQDALSHASRLRSVELDFNVMSRFRTARKDIFKGCLTGAPILETLIVKGGILERGESFPLGFFGNDTPSLQHLELHYCDTAWSTIPLSANLKYLFLFEDTPPHDSHTRPTFPQFLTLLDQLSVLETLTLMGYLPSFGSHPEANRPVTQAKLCSLRSLTLHDHASAIAIFARVVQIPEVTSVELGFYRETSPADLASALNNFREAWTDERVCRPVLEANVENLRVDASWAVLCYEGYSLRLQYAPTVSSKGCSARTLELCFRDDINVDISDYLPELVPFYADTLEILEIANIWELQPSVWSSSFLRCAKLHKVIFEDSPCAEDFLLALQDDPYQPLGTQPCDPLLPSLETIEFFSVGIDSNDIDWMPVTRLLRTLEKRKNTPSPVLEVIIKGCYNFGPRKLENLLSATGFTVNMDGHWEGSDWEDEDHISDDGDLSDPL